MTGTASNILVCNYTIAIDHRERNAAYTFGNMPINANQIGCVLVVPWCFKHLATGDYSIIGYESKIAVERKELSDLFNTLGRNRDRFDAEMQRLSEMDYAAIVIEASWPEICRPKEARGEAWRSKLNPRSVWGTVFSWAQKYPKVHWFTMGTRRLAEIAVYEILNRWYQHGRERDEQLAGGHAPDS